MQSYRTSSIFRFSKDFEILKKMLCNGIYPNYCEEDLSFDGTEFIIGIPMASFCDIPMTLLDEHKSRYGNYGIALSKKWGIDKGITPVMYIANDDILHSVYYHYKQVYKFLKWYNTQEVQNKLINDTVIKGFPLDVYSKFLTAKMEHVINTHIIGYLKKYKGVYHNHSINNYVENEWRYIVPDVENTKWFWNKKSYMQWRFPHGIPAKGKKTPSKPAPSEALQEYVLNFTAEDIKYILVRNENFKKKIMELIKSLNTIGGNSYEYDEIQEKREILLSRIITLEQVQNDF